LSSVVDKQSATNNLLATLNNLTIQVGELTANIGDNVRTIMNLLVSDFVNVKVRNATTEPVNIAGTVDIDGDVKVINKPGSVLEVVGI
jgi:hypothetical protein